jgi:hypothetical protein
VPGTVSATLAAKRFAGAVTVLDMAGVPGLGRILLRLDRRCQAMSVKRLPVRQKVDG